jgi:ParB-like chromosome segregation protein Spo0J
MFQQSRQNRAMSPLKVSYKDPAQLRRRDRNPRTHTPKQIKKIAASIKEFGFINPVLIDGSDRIIAGHGRAEAAKLVGMADIPTVRVDHLTPAQVRAYVIADNRLAELAGWDRKLLALELQELSVELDFDVAITGFEIAEADILISELSKEAPDDADIVPEIDRTRPAISMAGDLWRVGDHYLLCGNALDAESYMRLLGRAKAELVFTDPPRGAILKYELPEWEVSTVRSPSLNSFARPVPMARSTSSAPDTEIFELTIGPGRGSDANSRTSTMLNLAASAATGAMSGPMPA